MPIRDTFVRFCWNGLFWPANLAQISGDRAIFRRTIAFVALTSACQADETVTAYLEGAGAFRLVALDGTPFQAP